MMVVVVDAQAASGPLSGLRPLARRRAEAEVEEVLRVDDGDRVDPRDVEPVDGAVLRVQVAVHAQLR